MLPLLVAGLDSLSFMSCSRRTSIDTPCSSAFASRRALVSGLISKAMTIILYVNAVRIAEADDTRKGPERHPV